MDPGSNIILSVIYETVTLCFSHGLNAMTCSLFGDIFGNRGYLRPWFDLSQWEDDRIFWNNFVSTDISKNHMQVAH